MTVTASDIEQSVSDCRTALFHGGALDGPALRRIIDVLEDLSGAGAQTPVATIVADVDTQFDILDAFTGGDAAATIVAAIATASTALRADAAALDALPLVDVVVDVNDVLDGR